MSDSHDDELYDVMNARSPDNPMKGFQTYGKNAEGKPKWFSFPCQRAAAGANERCMVPINGQRFSNGATWNVEGGVDAPGELSTPTLRPSVLCAGAGACHFHINAGKFDYCDDHKGRTNGNE